MHIGGIVFAFATQINLCRLLQS